MSTKFKIILIIFAVILGLFLIQYMVTAVANSTKRENFQVEKKNPDTKVKLSALETLEDIFEKNYKDAIDQKPAIFDALMKKETFKVLKEKYEEGEVSDYISDFVKKTLKKIEKPVEPEETMEEQEKKPMKRVEEKLDEMEKNLMVEEFQEITNRLDNVLESIAALKAQLAEKGKQKKTPLIEGFENRTNYANYK